MSTQVVTVSPTSSAQQFTVFLGIHYNADKTFWDPFIAKIVGMCRLKVMSKLPVFEGGSGRSRRKSKRRRHRGGVGGTEAAKKKKDFISFETFFLAIPAILIIMGSFYIITTQPLETATQTVYAMCDKFTQSPMVFVQGMIATSASAVFSSVVASNRAILGKVESAFVGKDPFALSSLIGLAEKTIKIANELAKLVPSTSVTSPLTQESKTEVIKQIEIQTEEIINTIDQNREKHTPESVPETDINTTFQQIQIPANSILLIPKGASMTPVSGGKRKKTFTRRRKHRLGKFKNTYKKKH